MSKRKPAYAAFFVIGLGLLPLAIAGNNAFWGVAVVFFVVGAAGLAGEKRKPEKESRRRTDDPNAKGGSR
jgi:hypothetical protein